MVWVTRSAGDKGHLRPHVWFGHGSLDARCFTSTRAKSAPNHWKPCSRVLKNALFDVVLTWGERFWVGRDEVADRELRPHVGLSRGTAGTPCFLRKCGKLSEKLPKNSLFWV